MSTSHDRRRIAKALPRRDLAGRQPQLALWPGVVASVTAGAASDGNPLVTVTYGGTTVAAAYPSNYTPAAGHVVLIAVQDGAVVILQRTIGTP